MEDRFYEEVGRNYRFFLGWRHAAFAGNVVVIYGVISLSITAFQRAPDYAWLVPLIGSPIGLLLWMIDVRTRDLYHAAMRAGKTLEGQVGGFYTELSEVSLPKDGGFVRDEITQSGALDMFFLGSAFLMALAAIVLA